MFRKCAQVVSVLVVAVMVGGVALAAEAHVVESKLRAKFSGKKITVKGKVVGAGDWPVGLRLELVDAQDEAIASASDSLRGGDSFQIELAAAKGQKFEREQMVNTRLRYLLRRGKKEEESGAVALREICPKLTKKKRWW